MRYLTLMALLTGLVSVAVGARAAIGAPATSCTTCHRGIEDAHPKKALTCTQCHRGDATAQDADRKSTRLNSSHLVISYAVFCLKKKKHHALRNQSRFR